MGPLRDHRRRWGAVALCWVACAVALLVPAGAAAQDVPTSGGEQFFGYSQTARSNALQLTYDSPGTFPFSPVVQISVPEALATLTTGPNAFARSSLAFPGELLANLPQLIEQSGTEAPDLLQPYSVKAEASSPSGPFDQKQTQGPVSQEAHAEGELAEARTSFAGLSVAPFVHVGAVVSTSRTTIVGEEVVSRTRTELSGVSVLAGVLQIESIVTDLVATSDGEAGATGGGTSITGVSLLGFDATITKDGIELTEVPPEPANPIGNPLADLLDLAEPLTGPLNDLLASLTGPLDDALVELFEATGIQVRLAEPDESVDGALGERSSEGLLVEADYDGATTPLISDLLAAIPTERLPDEPLIPGLPLNTSPQALVNLLKDTHVVTVAMAPGVVSADANRAVELGGSGIDTSGAATTPPPPSSSPPLGSAGDFTTPAPTRPAAQQAASGPVGGGSEPIFAFGRGLPAILLLLALLSVPLLAAGSGRLADHTLAAAGRSCPDGLDDPDPDGGRPS